MSRQLKTVGAGAALLILTLSAWVTLDTERAPMSTGNESTGNESTGEESTGEEIAEAANRFLATLETDQRDRATYDLTADERLNWNFVPTARNGLPLKDMALEQRTAAHRLLQATVSSQGYQKANAIIELERILGILEGRPERRDPEQYFVTIFGTPSATDPWGWRFEGHHLSLNFTSPSSDLFITGPAFMGANPATVPSGPKAGMRALGAEEDLARALVRSLNTEQRSRAVLDGEAPRDIITGSDREVALQGFEGLPAADLTDAQRGLLMRVIGEYVGNMDAASAHGWLTRIADMDPSALYFAWAGGLEPGEGHYYRIHAPSFLIEYDNTQNDANHVHSVWRDLQNDFGGDALAQHYRDADHPH